MTHDHNGILGAIYGLAGYGTLLMLELIPDVNHFVQGIFTAACCALVGWIVTTVCKEVYKYFRPTIAERFFRLFKRKK